LITFPPFYNQCKTAAAAGPTIATKTDPRRCRLSPPSGSSSAASPPTYRFLTKTTK
jgi:RNA recognition motif-containing protein